MPRYLIAIEQAQTTMSRKLTAQKRGRCRGAALAVAFSLTFVMSARAQTLPPGTYAPTLRTFDLLTGQNKTGPYTLAWNNLQVSLQNKVIVEVNGTRLPDDGYTLDAAKGTITFNAPLKADTMARVTYTYDGQKSRRNADFTSAPVTVPLLHVGETSFAVTALPTGADTNGETRLVYGVDKKMRLSGGTISSQALFSPGGAATKIGYALGNDRNGLDAQFGRTERDFASRVGKGVGLADPLQTYKVGGRYRPMTWLGATIAQSEQRDLLGKSGVRRDNTYGMTLGGVGATPTLGYTRSASEIAAVRGAGESATTQEKIEFAARLGTTAIKATNLRAVTDAPDKKADTTATETNVSVAAIAPDKTAQATIAITDTSKETATSVEDKQSVAVKFQPSPALVLGAEQKEQTTTPLKPDGSEGKAQTVTTQTASAELNPLAGAKLTGAVSETDTGDAKIAATDLNAQVGVGAHLELAGGHTNRSTNTTGATTLDTTRARFALRPVSFFTVTGGYTLNPEKDGQVIPAMREELGFKAKFGRLDVGTGYSLTTLNGLAAGDASDPQYGEVSLTMGLRVSRFTTLSGQYKDGLLWGGADTLTNAVAPRSSRLYGVGLTHSIGSAFNFTMNGTRTDDRTQTGKTPDFKAEAKMGLKF